MLVLNMQPAWSSHATLGMDEDSGEIFYMFKTGMDGIAPRSFLVSLQHVAREVEAWIDEHQASHGRGARAPGQLLQPGFARV